MAILDGSYATLGGASGVATDWERANPGYATGMGGTLTPEQEAARAASQSQLNLNPNQWQQDQTKLMTTPQTSPTAQWNSATNSWGEQSQAAKDQWNIQNNPQVGGQLSGKMGNGREALGAVTAAPNTGVAPPQAVQSGPTLNPLTGKWEAPVGSTGTDITSTIRNLGNLNTPEAIGNLTQLMDRNGWNADQVGAAIGFTGQQVWDSINGYGGAANAARAAAAGATNPVEAAQANQPLQVAPLTVGGQPSQLANLDQTQVQGFLPYVSSKYEFAAPDGSKWTSNEIPEGQSGDGGGPGQAPSEYYRYAPGSSTGDSYQVFDTDGKYLRSGKFQEVNPAKEFVKFVAIAAALATGGAALGMFGAGGVGAGFGAGALGGAGGAAASDIGMMYAGGSAADAATLGGINGMVGTGAATGAGTAGAGAWTTAAADSQAYNAALTAAGGDPLAGYAAAGATPTSVSINGANYGIDALNSWPQPDALNEQPPGSMADGTGSGYPPPAAPPTNQWPQPDPANEQPPGSMADGTGSGYPTPPTTVTEPAPGSSPGTTPKPPYAPGGPSANGGTNIADIVKAITALGAGKYGSDAQAKTAQDQRDWLDKQMANIDKLYAEGSPELDRMRQEMERKDAAAGRNSQYGTRAVDLAAKVAETKAKYKAQIAMGTQGAMMQALQQGNSSYDPLIAALGSLTQNGSSVKDVTDWLTNLFK